MRDGSSSGLFILSTGRAPSYHLKRPTSSTSAELDAIKQALYILCQQPAQWVILTDWETSLQTIGRISCFKIHEHISRDVSRLNHLVCDSGHRVTLQVFRERRTISSAWKPASISPSGRYNFGTEVTAETSTSARDFDPSIISQSSAHNYVPVQHWPNLESVLRQLRFTRNSWEYST